MTLTRNATEERRRAKVCCAAPRTVVDAFISPADQKKTSKPEPKAKPRVPVQPPVASSSLNAYRPKKSAEDESSFMADLLGDLDSAPVPAVTRTRKRKTSPSADFSSSPPYRSGKTYDDSSSDGFGDDAFFLDAPSDDVVFSPKKKIKTDPGMSSPTQRLGQMGMHSSDAEPIVDDFEDIDMDMFNGNVDLDDDEVDVKPVMKKAVVAKQPPKKADPDAVPAWLKVYESLPVAESDPMGALQTSGSTSNSSSDVLVLEEDGSVRFFWLDYLELDGKLYFTGKLQDKNTGQWISCCVTVDGLERNVFVLPRERRMELDEEENLVPTDEVPTEADIRSDFNALRQSHNIKKFKGKFVKRKYAFAETDVPREERDWFKVVYPFDRECMTPFRLEPS